MMEKQHHCKKKYCDRVTYSILIQWCHNTETQHDQCTMSQFISVSLKYIAQPMYSGSRMTSVPWFLLWIKSATSVSQFLNKLLLWVGSISMNRKQCMISVFQFLNKWLFWLDSFCKLKSHSAISVSQLPKINK